MCSQATNLLRAGLLLVGWAVAGCSGAHEPTHTTAPTPPRASVAHTANVPALLGKSIDDLRSKLGSEQALPAGYEDPLATTTADSLAAFRTGGLTVVASYDGHTRLVHSLLLLGRHEDSLVARASLQANAHNYLIMPVFFANNHNHLMGLRIVATQ